MKVAVFVLFLFSLPLAWASDNDTQALGRSLANYQVCSQVAIDIDDPQMRIYYQKMFNDVRLSILPLNAIDANKVYLTWNKSEQVLLKIGKENLQGICLSRFDALSRQVVSG